jgi:flagellin
MRINQNLMAANSSRNLTSTNSMMSKSLEKLSSGLRINRAADDAAGLVISQNLRAQVSGLRQATRNAQDGISVLQTAEGALNEVHTMLNRMRDLAVQGANTGGNDSASRSAAQSEIDQLNLEIDRISTNTKFGGTALLDGNFGQTPAMRTGLVQSSVTLTAGSTFTINIAGLGAHTVAIVGGAAAGSSAATAASVLASSINASLAGSAVTAIRAFANKVTASVTPSGGANDVTLNVGGLTAGQSFVLADGTGTPLAQLGTGFIGTSTNAAGTGGVFQVGSNSGDTVGVNITAVSSSALGVNAILVNTDANAAAAITAIDAAISSVSGTRGALGAMQNRFESMINNLSVTTENLQASESRIRDLDMANEMVAFTKNQVLQQAGTAMLSQANQIPQTILTLLRG